MEYPPLMTADSAQRGILRVARAASEDVQSREGSQFTDRDPLSNPDVCAHQWAKLRIL